MNNNQKRTLFEAGLVAAVLCICASILIILYKGTNIIFHAWAIVANYFLVMFWLEKIIELTNDEQR